MRSTSPAAPFTVILISLSQYACGANSPAELVPTASNDRDGAMYGSGLSRNETILTHATIRAVDDGFLVQGLPRGQGSSSLGRDATGQEPELVDKDGEPAATCLKCDGCVGSRCFNCVRIPCPSSYMAPSIGTEGLDGDVYVELLDE